MENKDGFFGELYVVTCPNCGCNKLQKVDLDTFECEECENEFEIDVAEVEILQK